MMSAWKKCLCRKSAWGKFWFAFTRAGFVEPISRRSLADRTARRAFLVTRLQVSSRKLAKAFVSSLLAIASLCFITSRVENVITASTKPSRNAQLTRRSAARQASRRRGGELLNMSGGWDGLVGG